MATLPNALLVTESDVRARARSSRSNRAMATSRRARLSEATMTSMACRRISIGLAAAGLLFGVSTDAHAQKYVKGERPQTRGYSLAVITEGGRTVWLGGQIATVDDTGKSLAGDFDGQVRQIF